MKRIALLAGLVVAGVQISEAAACTSGTLAGFEALGSSGCTIGSNLLYNFASLAGTTGATEIAASSVQLTPLVTGVSTTVSVTSSTGKVQEVLFTYQIAGGPYSGVSAALSGSSETVDGAVTGLVNFCAGGSFGADGVSGCTGKAGGLVTVDGVQNQDAAATAAVLLSVTNDLTVDGGQAGSASGGTLVDRFSVTATTPEPAGAWLAGGGLALLGLARIGRNQYWVLRGRHKQ